MSIDIPADRLSAVIGKIYDSAVDSALWPDALEGACGLIGATLGSIAIYDVPRKSARWAARWGGDPHWMRLYEDQYATMMPFWSTMSHYDLGQGANTRDMVATIGVSEEEFRNSQFFTEWAKPAGLNDVVSYVILRTEDRSGMLQQFGTFQMYTPPTRDVVAPRDMEIAALLTPHVHRAVTIGDLLDQRSIAATAFEETLDKLAIAVVLVDAYTRIRHANVAAQAMLSAGAPVSAQNGELRASSPQATLALSTAIARAAANETQIGLAGIGIPVTGEGGRPAIAHVLPLKSGKLRPELGSGAAAAVFVTPAQDHPLPPADALAALYELTPTEARVLVAIASGKNRAATAEALGIADSTVKTHLARIFTKTGASEQSELAKLVSSLAAPVKPST